MHATSGWDVGCGRGARDGGVWGQGVGAGVRGQLPEKAEKPP